jgi:SOS regulatory protein LexA
MKETYLKDLQKFYKKNKRLPSYSEMLSLFGLASKNAIHKITKKLIESGYLDKVSGKLAPANLFFQVPLLGNVKAGFPTGAEEDLNFMSLDEYLVDKPGASFMLRVAGDSLEGIGIFKGDIVILEKAKSANRGEIVLALIDGEWTLKIIERVDGKTVLRSANTKYPDFYPHLSLEIFGIVRSVIRKY